jgi:hypothetical protein
VPLIRWLRRRSPWARGPALVVLLVGAAAVAAVVLTHGVSKRAHRSLTGAVTTSAARGARRPRSPVPAPQIARARRVAQEFLAGYLPFAYGRASPASVRGVTHALRRQLIHEHAQVTPVERRRRPRVVLLAELGQASGVVVATALIEDGGIAFYAVRLTVRRTTRGWLVSGIDGG